jgi:hypothetical protein
MKKTFVLTVREVVFNYFHVSIDAEDEEAAFAAVEQGGGDWLDVDGDDPPEKFGVLDIEDLGPAEKPEELAQLATP